MFRTRFNALTIIALSIGVGAGLGAAGVWLSLGQAGGLVAGDPDSPDGGAMAGMADGMPPARVRAAAVRAAAVREEAVRDRFTVIGRLEQVRAATVAAEVSGKVIEAGVDVGDAVTAERTPLARIEETWVELELAAAEADITSAQAELDRAQRELAYLEQLQGRGAARPKEVDDARAAVDSHRARLQRHTAARDRASEQARRLVIRPPFDGWVVEKHAEVGQWVSAGSPIARIISRGEIEAVLNVPERLIHHVRVGDAISVSVDAGEVQAEATVASVTPTGDSAARTFPVRARLDDRDGQLKPGMSVTARLATAEEQTRLTLPRDAVQFRGGEAVVWAVRTAQDDAPPTAARITVRVLFATGERLVVEPLPGDELSAGTDVVIEGAQMLQPGQPLNVIEHAGEPGPGPTADAGADPVTDWMTNVD